MEPDREPTRRSWEDRRAGYPPPSSSDASPSYRPGAHSSASTREVEDNHYRNRRRRSESGEVSPAPSPKRSRGDDRGKERDWERERYRDQRDWDRHRNWNRDREPERGRAYERRPGDTEGVRDRDDLGRTHTSSDAVRRNFVPNRRGRGPSLLASASLPARPGPGVAVSPSVSFRQSSPEKRGRARGGSVDGWDNAREREGGGQSGGGKDCKVAPRGRDRSRGSNKGRRRVSGSESGTSRSKSRSRSTGSRERIGPAEVGQGDDDSDVRNGGSKATLSRRQRRRTMKEAKLSKEEEEDRRGLITESMERFVMTLQSTLIARSVYLSALHHSTSLTEFYHASSTYTPDAPAPPALAEARDAAEAKRAEWETGKSEMMRAWADVWAPVVVVAHRMGRGERGEAGPGEGTVGNGDEGVDEMDEGWWDVEEVIVGDDLLVEGIEDGLKTAPGGAGGEVGRPADSLAEAGEGVQGPAAGNESGARDGLGAAADPGGSGVAGTNAQAPARQLDGANDAEVQEEGEVEESIEPPREESTTAPQTKSTTTEDKQEPRQESDSQDVIMAGEPSRPPDSISGVVNAKGSSKTKRRARTVVRPGLGSVELAILRERLGRLEMLLQRAQRDECRCRSPSPSRPRADRVGRDSGSRGREQDKDSGRAREGNGEEDVPPRPTTRPTSPPLSPPRDPDRNRDKPPSLTREGTGKQITRKQKYSRLFSTLWDTRLEPVLADVEERLAELEGWVSVKDTDEELARRMRRGRARGWEELERRRDPEGHLRGVVSAGGAGEGRGQAAGDQRTSEGMDGGTVESALVGVAAGGDDEMLGGAAGGEEEVQEEIEEEEEEEEVEQVERSPTKPAHASTSLEHTAQPSSTLDSAGGSAKSVTVTNGDSNATASAPEAANAATGLLSEDSTDAKLAVSTTKLLRKLVKDMVELQAQVARMEKEREEERAAAKAREEELMRAVAERNALEIPPAVRKELNKAIHRWKDMGTSTAPTASTTATATAASPALGTLSPIPANLAVAKAQAQSPYGSAPNSTLGQGQLQSAAALADPRRRSHGHVSPLSHHPQAGAAVGYVALVPRSASVGSATSAQGPQAPRPGSAGTSPLPAPAAVAAAPPPHAVPLAERIGAGAGVGVGLGLGPVSAPGPGTHALPTTISPAAAGTSDPAQRIMPRSNSNPNPISSGQSSSLHPQPQQQPQLANPAMPPNSANMVLSPHTYAQALSQGQAMQLQQQQQQQQMGWTGTPQQWSQMQFHHSLALHQQQQQQQQRLYEPQQQHVQIQQGQGREPGTDGAGQGQGSKPSLNERFTSHQ